MIDLSPYAVKNDYRHNACPLCGSQELYSMGSISYASPILFSTILITISNEPELWGCRKCQSRFVQNTVDENTARKLYSMGQAGERWPSKIFNEEKTIEVVHRMAEIFKCAGTVLDIGCNTGELLDFALGFGCKTSGVEFSTASREVLHRKGHQSYTSFEDVPEKYDVITAFDVVEHLYDVPAFIKGCIGKLTEKGRLILLTGNIDCLSARLSGCRWWYAQLAEHIVFPSKRFISDLPGIRIEKWVPCYPGKWAEYPKYVGYKDMLNGVLRRRQFTGMPSPVPDHTLIVLRK